VDAEPQIDKAEELRKKWGVERGQIWELGEHRLMCGDSTSLTEMIGLVKTGADLVITSPPYNVGVEYASHDDSEVPWPQYEKFLTKCLEAIMPALSKGRAFIWNIGTSPKTHHVRQHILIEKFGLTYYRQMIWKKVGVPVPLWFNTVNNPRARQFTPNYQHEIVLIFTNGKLDRGENVSIDPLCENDVFEFGQQFATTDIPEGLKYTGAQSNLDRRSKKAHPAAFPVRIPKMFVNHFTSENETVLEPFAGAGATIIACEQLGRKCRAMEIDPGYVAVSIQRWADATGKNPSIAPELVHSVSK
jgi:DNA modification methylase